jgi:hypothetical protein
VLDRLPKKKHYCAGGMMQKKKKQFDRWYEENRNQPFDLREALFEYCSSDVRLLAHGLIKMQEIFREATGMDITRCLTLSVGFLFFVSGKNIIRRDLLGSSNEILPLPAGTGAIGHDTGAGL